MQKTILQLLGQLADTQPLSDEEAKGLRSSLRQQNVRGEQLGRTLESLDKKVKTMDSAFKELSAKVEADHKVQLNTRNVANALARTMNLDKVHETVTQWQVAESNRVKRAAEQADETCEMLKESVRKSERQLERIRQQTSMFGGGIKAFSVGFLMPFALVLFSVTVVTRCARNLIGENEAFLDALGFKRFDLSGEVLVGRGHAGIADSDRLCRRKTTFCTHVSVIQDVNPAYTGHWHSKEDVGSVGKGVPVLHIFV
ncbi:hypothetical protein CCASP_00815 [Corynebacterium caspium DSM 44850]|nr:hypothetical protein CCASP_00815 [Corynebacterium caspium DSM 44850]